MTECFLSLFFTLIPATPFFLKTEFPTGNTLVALKNLPLRSKSNYAKKILK